MPLRGSSEGTSYRQYKTRSTCAEPLELKDDRVLLLTGEATDAYDGNITPCKVALCRPPAHMVPPDAEVDLNGLFLGERQDHAGSLHNEPVKRTLLGHLKSPESDGKYTTATVEWREHTGSFGHWVYRGRFWPNGCIISGTFHLSCLPRKHGTFQLRVTDPAVFGEGWWSVSRAVLTGRVMVRWAVGSVKKRVRQQELIAEAAAVQEGQQGQAAVEVLDDDDNDDE